MSLALEHDADEIYQDIIGNLVEQAGNVSHADARTLAVAIGDSGDLAISYLAAQSVLEAAAGVRV